MCTYSGPWGWWSLTALLDLALINPFDVPTFRWRGVIWAWMATSKAQKTAEEGVSSASPIPSTAETEALGSTPLDSWGDCLDMVMVGTWWHHLGGVGQRTWKNVIQLPSGAGTNPLPPILPQLVVLSVAHPSPIPVPPPVVHSPIVLNPAPGKEKKGSVTKVRLSHKIVKEQSDRLSSTKETDIPDSTTPMPPPLPMPAPPSPTTTALIYIVLFFWCHSLLLPFWWLICAWDNPKWAKRIWLGDQVNRCLI